MVEREDGELLMNKDEVSVNCLFSNLNKLQRSVHKFEPIVNKNVLNT